MNKQICLRLIVQFLDHGISVRLIQHLSEKSQTRELRGNATNMYTAGWWFGTFFIFFIIYGMSSFPIDELHHFSRWLLHHQPDMYAVNSPFGISFFRSNSSVSTHLGARRTWAQRLSGSSWMNRGLWRLWDLDREEVRGVYQRISRDIGGSLG